MKFTHEISCRNEDSSNPGAGRELTWKAIRKYKDHLNKEGIDLGRRGELLLEKFLLNKVKHKTKIKLKTSYKELDNFLEGER